MLKCTGHMTPLASAIALMLLSFGTTGNALAQNAPPLPQPTPAQPGDGALGSVVVTGSRIPRAQAEGPAPVTVVTAAQIKASGFTSVPEVLHSLAENSGSVQGQQNTTGAQSTPGAQAVDLRGLGPNHTLVLVNGRRIADFPLPMNGRSNFTDIGNIPLGMIERVEVLTGSASAVYGSDAMAGVINFILKKSTDGTTIDYRYSTTANGGAGHDLTLTTGFSRGNFNAIVGFEMQDQKPLWGTDRKVQDSTLDAPSGRRQLPRLIAQRYDSDDDVNIAPADGCGAMAALNDGTTALAHNRYGEPYCGSTRAIAYRTIQNQRRGVNLYGSFEYAFSDTLRWFADMQLGRQTVKLLSGTGGNDAVSDGMGWEFHDPNSTSNYRSKMFYNANSGHYEIWSRQFTPEEMNGLRNRMNRTQQNTLGVTTGLRGELAQWTWEAAFNHSQYKAEVDMPRIRAAAANRLILGPQQGYDADGYAIFSPDPARLFTPLTPAEFDSIAAMSRFRPVAKNDNLSLSVQNAALFKLPAGDAGFAALVETGRQSYRINPDPLALSADAYYGPQYGDGKGSRNRWSAAAELRLPILSGLQASLAGRYDRYSYGGRAPGKFTYSLGMEWRPVQSLLVRGSYGTGFRAPDMHYLYAGNDYYRTRYATDYYRCRVDTPGASNSFCYDDGSWDTSTFDTYRGNLALNVETSKSFTAGLVFSPTPNLDFTADYYRISVMNQVQVQDRDWLRRTEADCRLGKTDSGQTVDTTSATCVDAIARVVRDANGVIVSMLFAPINIAREETSGLDITANYRLRTANAGTFRFSGSYNWTQRHTRTLRPGDVSENMLALSFSDTTLPRTKGSAGVSWDHGHLGASVFGNYLGQVANYANNAWTGATWRFNAGLRYDVNDHLRVAASVTNLLNSMPPRDATWSNYPYYDTSWFDAMGRRFSLQVTWKLGGKAL